MVDIQVEGCVTTLEEARSVHEAGGHRLELCRELHTGGLTPGADVVRAVIACMELPVMAMVRPKAGHFRASAGDVATMLRELEELADLHVDGVVLGVLTGENEVDSGALRELVHGSPVPVTLHKAFDETVDPLAALEVLMETGVSRVLTSGGADTAWDGREVLRELVAAAGEDLVVLGGGGVRGDHVQRLLDETGLREVHARALAVPGIMRALGLGPGEGGRGGG